MNKRQEIFSGYWEECLNGVIYAVACKKAPLGLLSAFVLKLPPMWVYFILSLDETIKMPANIIHYRKKGWLRNITRDKIT